jgi:ankyrin repeat protein
MTSTMRTAMEAAIGDNHYLLFYDLLERNEKNNNGVDINEKDEAGDTLLSMAVRNNCSSIVEFLLRDGAKPNMPNNTGTTPLMIARENKNEDIINQLLLKC